MTVREQWFCDAFELTQGWVRDVELRDGLYGVTSPRVSASPSPAARHGEVPPGRRKHSRGGFQLTVWTMDLNRDLAEQRYEEVLRSCAVQHRSPVWKRVLADGSARVAVGRLVDAIAPENLGNEGMRFELIVAVHSGFWRDETATIDMRTGAGALSLASKARSTAPMDDLRCTVTGPATNPSVLDSQTGLGWQYNGVVSAGQTLIVDSGAFADPTDPLVAGTGGLMPYVDEIEWTSDRFLEVPPTAPGTIPSVVFAATGVSGATQLEVAGKGAYLA